MKNSGNARPDVGLVSAPYVPGSSKLPELPDCEDLRPCSAHRLPINRCAACWPLFRKFLEDKTAQLILQKRKSERRA